MRILSGSVSLFAIKILTVWIKAEQNVPTEGQSYFQTSSVIGLSTPMNTADNKTSEHEGLWSDNVITKIAQNGGENSTNSKHDEPTGIPAIEIVTQISGLPWNSSISGYSPNSNSKSPNAQNPEDFVESSPHNSKSETETTDPSHQDLTQTALTSIISPEDNVTVKVKDTTETATNVHHVPVEQNLTDSAEVETHQIVLGFDSVTDVPVLETSPRSMRPAQENASTEGRFEVTTGVVADDDGDGDVQEKQGLIDLKTKDFILEIVNCYFIPIVCPFGLVGNVLSLVVLLCVHKGSNSTTVLLVALTFSDLGYLITTLMRKLSCVASKIDPERGWWLNIIFLPQVFMLNRVFNHVTSFTTMVISLERCVAVVWPFKVGLLITKTRMIVIVIFIYVISFALQGPFFFIYEIFWKTSEDGRKYPSYRTTSFYRHNEQTIITYNNLVLSNALVFAPMAVVCFCTVVILKKVTASMRFRQKASSVARHSGSNSRESYIGRSSDGTSDTTNIPSDSQDLETSFGESSDTVIRSISESGTATATRSISPGANTTTTATTTTTTNTTTPRITATTRDKITPTITATTRDKITQTINATTTTNTMTSATTATTTNTKIPTSTTTKAAVVVESKARPRKKEKLHIKGEQKKVTSMLCIIAVIYLVCNLPTAVTKLVNYIEPEFSSRGGRYTNIFLVCSGTNILLLCVNSSVNFLIYVATSSSLGTSFRRMLPRCFRFRST